MTPVSPPAFSTFLRLLLIPILSSPFIAGSPVISGEVPGSAVSPVPGHSMHGEAFNDGPRQSAYLMGNTGHVHFPITSKHGEVQQYFDQGIGQLHGFWYYEAERSFRQVSKLDPDCAMAYWGLSMANINNKTRAKEFIATAEKKKSNASPREQVWISTLFDFYSGEDNLESRRKQIRGLESLVQDYPNDPEAKAFLVFQIWKNSYWERDGKKELPLSSHQSTDALLDQIFQLNPMHPSHHYRIHLWDNEKPSRALVSASLNGQVASSIAHMWHMPGHTYSKVHRYRDAIWQQEASARVDHSHMHRDRVMPGQIHNYAHNNEWLIRNLIFTGQKGRARELAENMLSIPRHPKQNNLKEQGSCAAFGRERLRGVLFQFELWEEILALEMTELFQSLPDNPADEIDLRRTLVHAAFHLKKTEDVSRHVASLERYSQEKRTARYLAADAVEKKSREEKKSESVIAGEVAGELLKQSDRLKDLEAAIVELKAFSLFAIGQETEAKAEFQKLKSDAKTPKVPLARTLSLCNDHEGAIEVARKSVEQGINEVLPQATLVEVLHRAGKIPEATTEFAKLRTVAGEADPDLPILTRLKPLAATLQYPEDWRIPNPPATDVGVRPKLDNLGPFRWEPSAATPWKLTGGNDAMVSLDDYSGKPVIVILYLGSGCLHCVEQLKQFASHHPDYSSAGLSIVAISSESLESLKKSIENFGQDKGIPFPLLADPSLEVFKQYRAYDDFEMQPLHGTFLIDGRGMIRWQEISFEPFSDPDYLLQEAQRLLQLGS